MILYRKQKANEMLTEQIGHSLDLSVFPELERNALEAIAVMYANAQLWKKERDELAERIAILEESVKFACQQINSGSSYCSDCQKGTEWLPDELIEYVQQHSTK